MKNRNRGGAYSNERLIEVIPVERLEEFFHDFMWGQDFNRNVSELNKFFIGIKEFICINADKSIIEAKYVELFATFSHLCDVVRSMRRAQLQHKWMELVESGIEILNLEAGNSQTRRSIENLCRGMLHSIFPSINYNDLVDEIYFYRWLLRYELIEEHHGIRRWDDQEEPLIKPTIEDLDKYERDHKQKLLRKLRDMSPNDYRSDPQRDSGNGRYLQLNDALNRASQRGGSEISF